MDAWQHPGSPELRGTGIADKLARRFYDWASPEGSFHHSAELQLHRRLVAPQCRLTQGRCGEAHLRACTEALLRADHPRMDCLPGCAGAGSA